MMPTFTGHEIPSIENVISRLATMFEFGNEIEYKGDTFLVEESTISYDEMSVTARRRYYGREVPTVDYRGVQNGVRLLKCVDEIILDTAELMGIYEQITATN